MYKEYRPAALLKPAGDVVPHVVWFKGVEQKVGCFYQLCRLLVFTKFTRKAKKVFLFLCTTDRYSLYDEHNMTEETSARAKEKRNTSFYI